MFYLPRSDINICAIALPLSLMIAFFFLIVISTVYGSEEIVQYKYQN